MRTLRAPWLMGPLIALGALAVTAVGLELAARVWVAVKWSAENVSEVVDPVTHRGGFIADSLTVYRLQPDFTRVNRADRRFTHNASGIRRVGPLAPTTDGRTRIVMVGASTVYGVKVSDSATSAARLEALLTSRYPERRFEVVNLGVPGWTSRETVLRLEQEIEVLAPDVTILLDGRNELFPQSFNDFRQDYSHYRIVDWRLDAANSGWKRLFRVSHLAMLLLHDREGGRTLGYSIIDEDPVYGNIRFENRPEDADTLLANLRDPARDTAWRRNVERLIDLSLEAGAPVVLVEMPFRVEGFATGVLPLGLYDENRRGEVAQALEARVAANNAILRALSGRDGVSFVELDSLVDPAYLVDDCHFNEAGEEALAVMLADHLGARTLAE